MRWMLRRDAPLLMNPKASWHKYSWMAEFVRHIPDYRQNTIETVRLAIEWSAPLGLDRLGGRELTGAGFPRRKAYAEKPSHVQH
jgi:hypothetical protein